MALEMGPVRVGFVITCLKVIDNLKKIVVGGADKLVRIYDLNL